MKNKKQLLMLFTMILVLLQPFTVYSIDPPLARVIVYFHEQIDPNLIESYGGKVEKEFTTMQAAAGTLPEKNISLLFHHPKVAFIDKDNEVYIENQRMDWGIPKVNAPKVWNHLFTGKGIKVAVIDTGIDLTHPDLPYKKAISFVDAEPSAADGNGHGTHVAGIIGAKNNNIGSVGVAPDAEIYVAKVLDKDGLGLQSSVIQAIEWAIAERVDIINMSLGSAESSYGLEMAVNKARDNGILVVAAAGNKGNAQGTGTNVEYPASYPSVIAVAAVDQSDNRASFSATGTAVELAAPGVQIFSTSLNGGYSFYSGTSMATPYVAGMLALLKEMKPKTPANELRTTLQSQAIDLGVAGKDTWFGYGRIRLSDAFIESHTIPVKPNNFQVNQTGDAITLSWDHPQSLAPIAEYRIFENDKLIAQVASTMNTYQKAANPGTYSYYMKSFSTVGKESERTEIRTIEISGTKEQANVQFTDLEEGKYYTEPMKSLVEEKIIFGYSDNTIRPNDTIKRADAALMLSRALKIPVSKNPIQFSDVPQTHYAAGAIQAATEQGILTGYNGGIFKPDAPISRGEVAAVLVRAYNPVPTMDVRFPDVLKSYFAYDAINTVAGASITTGYPDGTFRPLAFVTRGEFSTFIFRVK